MTRFSIRRNDWILISILLLVPVLMLVWQGTKNPARGNQVVITVKGETYKVMDLGKDAEIVIEQESSFNVVNISNGEATMTSADCRDQVCVHTKPVSKVGEQIVCLPNRVVVEIKGDGDRDVDAVSE